MTAQPPARDGETWPSYEPHRDHRFEYAGDAVRDIEAHTCHLGCWRAGSAADIEEFGPGGTCDILASLFFLTGPQPKIEDRGDDGLFCNARQDRDVHPDQTTIEVTL